jgi:cytochrome P450
VEGSPEDQAQATAEMLAYAGGLAERRLEHPRDDIVTRLLQPDDAGQVPSTAEFGFFFVLLMLAGNETTRNAASGGMLAFFEHPDQWQRLRADPTLAAAAAEKIVRWITPVNLFRRTATCDTDLAGQKIAEGGDGRAGLGLAVAYQPARLRLSQSGHDRLELVHEMGEHEDVGRFGLLPDAYRRRRSRRVR